MFNTLGILISSSIIGAIYFLLDFDFNYWIYVAMYTIAHGLLSLLSAFFYLDMGASAGMAAIYVWLNIIIYFIIGLGVVYILRTLKGGDTKMVVGAGVIIQSAISILISQLLSGIFSFDAF